MIPTLLFSPGSPRDVPLDREESPWPAPSQGFCAISPHTPGNSLPTGVEGQGSHLLYPCGSSLPFDLVWTTLPFGVEVSRVFDITVGVSGVSLRGDIHPSFPSSFRPHQPEG